MDIGDVLRKRMLLGRTRPTRRDAGSLLAAVVAFAICSPAAPAGAATGSLTFSVPREVRVGDVVPLTAQAQRARNVVAFQATVRFDHARAERNGLRLGKSWNGFGVEPLGPVALRDSETFGMYSCRTRECRAGRRAVGPRSSARIATFELRASRPGVLRLSLGRVRSVDRAGRVTAYGRERVLLVRVRPEGADVSRRRVAVRLAGSSGARNRAVRRLDTTGDGAVDRGDSAEAAIAWNRAQEAGAPCARGASADLDGDGCLDVTDVDLVARAVVRTTDARRARRARAAVNDTIVVNSGGDGADTAADGVCRAADGSCTLRAAITEANRQSGANAIAFSIPGGGVRTIQLTALLPTISDTSGPTTIDGYTQPEAAPNTDPIASNAQIKVQIAGNGYCATCLDALVISSANNVVRGLAIYNIRRSFSIIGTAADGNLIAGSFIGTNAAATASASVYNIYGTGVFIEHGASSNRIGGTAAADRNVISGNSRHGIGTYGVGADGNVIYNNIIGLSPLGDRRLENKKHGIDINEGSANNIIGGTGPGQRNVLSGNGFENLDDFTAAVEISHMAETVGNRVIGNYIGTNLTGTAAPSYTFNSHYGMRIEDGVNDVVIANNVMGNNKRGAIKIDAPGTRNIRIQDNLIGISNSGAAIPNPVFGIMIAYTASRVQVGPGNVITNSPVGVEVGHPDSDFNTITRNSIYGNTGLGIDLEPWPNTNPNDAGDGDAGSNAQLNFPDITRASTSSVGGNACAGCTVEVFLADAGAGAYGEGRQYIGSIDADSTGKWLLPISGHSAGQYVTATATDAAGNTSEFGLNAPLSASSDTTPPTTSITCNGGACAATEYAAAVQVALSASDAGGSGVNAIRYTLDGTDPTSSSPTYSGPFSVTRDTTVKFRAWDNAGNVESVRSQTILVANSGDTTAPVSSITCNGTTCQSGYSSAVTVALSATDAGGSGLESIHYTLNGSDPTLASPVYTAPFSVPATTTVKFRAWDNAGNVEAVRSQTIQIQGVFVSDAFERTVASGLGSADVGGAWSVNSTTRTKVGGGEATIYGWTGGNQDTHAWNTAIRNDMELVSLVRLNPTDPVGGNYLARLVARAQSDARNGYSARITHTAAGGLTWGLSRVDQAGGTGTVSLGGGTLLTAGAAGGSWWIRLRVEGTTIRVRYWLEGTAEPGTWNASVTDSYWASGRASFGAYVDANVASPFPTVGFKTFTALDLGGVASGNTPPSASFTRSCTDLACQFTSTSTDADGSIAGQSWTFGDGASSTAASPSHTYAGAGTYTVTLTVTDNEGATAATSQQVTVAAANVPPSASFTRSCTYLDCQFTSTSTDPDGTVAAHSWNFGDGTSATAASPSHSYAAEGTYTVTLTVTDDRGGTAATSVQVTVTAPPIALSTRGYKVKGKQKVDLTWSGASTANVDVYRNGAVVATIPNSGAYTDNLNLTGAATYTYRVCEAGGTTVCSNSSVVTF